MQGYFLTVTGDWEECPSLEIFEKHPALRKGEGAFLLAGLRVHNHLTDFLSWLLGSLVSWIPEHP